MIIDSHQHFWNFDPQRDTWIDHTMEVLRRDFTPRDLELILSKNKVEGCIAVQADQSERETAFLLDCAAKYSFVKGVVGWVDLCAPQVNQRLSHFSKNPYFKGLRHIVQAEEDNFLFREDFQRGIRMLSNFDLTYDLLITPNQLAAANTFVKKFPNQKFILDHLAKPEISKPISETWIKEIESLAEHPNTYCKLSGMVTETQNFQSEKKDFTPFMEVIINSFGSDRVLFGSDWPVCLLATEYEKVLKIVTDFIEKYVPSEKNKILGANTIRIYNL
jgi:L-fuconolactonase